MLLSHRGKTPQIHPSAYVAPTATVCGDVVIGADCRIMHGAQVIAEDGQIAIGDCCVVLENAVIRSTPDHGAQIGRHCVVGPGAHLVGCTVEDEVFIATGSAIFHDAHIGKGAEVRIHGVVHICTRVPAGATVPIGWVAVGDPAQILPPDQHEAIWAAQRPLNFPLVAYGIDRTEADMVKITRHLSDRLSAHQDDTVVD